MLNFAIETARDAGQLLLEKFGRGIAVHKKGDINLVTEADLASEALIIERIKSYYPKHSILAEESGDAVVIGGENTWKWIIDPLDGTTNFAHGYPCFCVTLALEHDGEIVIGVTFDPTRNDLFAAERGRGASLNGKPIRVSQAEELSEALIVTGFPYDFKRREDCITASGLHGGVAACTPFDREQGRFFPLPLVENILFKSIATNCVADRLRDQTFDVVRCVPFLKLLMLERVARHVA